MVIGLVVGAVVVSLVVAVAGFRDALDVMTHMDAAWIVLALSASAMRVLLYGIQLTVIGRRSGSLRLVTGIELALVVYGLGAITPVSPAEGLTMASRELRRRGRSAHEARIALATSEWFTQRAFYAVAAADLIVVVLLGRLTFDESWPLFVAAVVVLAGLLGTAALAYRPASAEWAALVMAAIRLRRWETRHEARQAGAAWHADAMAVVGPPSRRLRLAAMGAIAVMADAAALWAACRAAGVEIAPDLALLAAAVGTMASWVPVLPSGLGVVEATIPAVLHRFGADLDAALAATIAYRTVAVLVPALFGGLAMAGLRRRAELFEAVHEDARRTYTPGGIIPSDSPSSKGHSRCSSASTT
jgi:uncharacterized protein (TIRG00374 family)